MPAGCGLAPPAAALAEVVTRVSDCACTPTPVLPARRALSAVRARVVLRTTLTATLPPTALLPAAEASTAASTVVRLLATSSVLSAVLASSALPSRSTLAVVSAMTIAAPASAGSAPRSGRPGRASMVVVVVAPRRAGPALVIRVSPWTRTLAATSTSTTASGTTSGVAMAAVAVASRVARPLASSVDPSTSIVALVVLVTSGASVLRCSALACRCRSRPVRVAPLASMRAAVSDKASSVPPTACACSVTSPPAWVSLPAASSLPPLPMRIVGARRAMSPEAAIDTPLRRLASSPTFTRREETVPVSSMPLSPTISMRPWFSTTAPPVARPCTLTTSLKSGAPPANFAPLSTLPPTVIEPADRPTWSVALTSPSMRISAAVLRGARPSTRAAAEASAPPGASKKSSTKRWLGVDTCRLPTLTLPLGPTTTPCGLAK